MVVPLSSHPWGSGKPTSNGKQSSFSRIFKNNNSYSFHDVIPGLVDSSMRPIFIIHAFFKVVPNVILGEDVIEKLVSPFEFSLVGKFACVDHI